MNLSWKNDLEFVEVKQTDASVELMDAPQKAVVANRLLSRGGAHFAQIPWQAGYETPCRMRNKITAW